MRASAQHPKPRRSGGRPISRRNKVAFGIRAMGQEEAKAFAGLCCDMKRQAVQPAITRAALNAVTQVSLQFQVGGCRGYRSDRGVSFQQAHDIEGIVAILTWWQGNEIAAMDRAGPHRSQLPQAMMGCMINMPAFREAGRAASVASEHVV
ncbi:hypothetical protein CYR75_01095 [Paracoccus jeotgali]|uniref:Uncharacterized protein n=1 Tax=Paracoccus jeotgali TaxID=2065379 RepID=A0A2K9MBR9_9RHOB|nr:hypothetical protein CYR75_01095 [Paracoccus jeotgali]